jgi:hypothetical protein
MENIREISGLQDIRPCFEKADGLQATQHVPEKDVCLSFVRALPRHRKGWKIKKITKIKNSGKW